MVGCDMTVCECACAGPEIHMLPCRTRRQIFMKKSCVCISLVKFIWILDVTRFQCTQKKRQKKQIKMRKRETGKEPKLKNQKDKCIAEMIVITPNCRHSIRFISSDQTVETNEWLLLTNLGRVSAFTTFSTICDDRWCPVEVVWIWHAIQLIRLIKMENVKNFILTKYDKFFTQYTS